MGITLPVLIVGFIGLFFGIGLAIASKKLFVYIDPRISKILEILPNANCGACGFPGCSGFSKAVVDGKAEPTGCVPGGAKVTSAIADILNVTASLSEPMVAVVHCNGGKNEALFHAKYDGIEDCNAAVLVGNGSKICQDGCLGAGTCVRACPFDAIFINDRGIAEINSKKCTGCGKCVKACPRKVISLIPKVHKIFLACSNHDRGAKVKKYCSVGCTACTLCIKATPSGAIAMENNLPVLDYTGEENFITAAYKCPSNCYKDQVKFRPKANIDTKCNGCGECIIVCPIKDAIEGTSGARHVVNKDRCIGCGICLNKCSVHAISLWGAGSVN